MGRVLSLPALLGATAIAAIAYRGAGAVTEPPPEPAHLGLYEWMETASIVVAGDVVEDDGRFVRAIVRTSIKGPLTAGSTVEIDQRQANRDREDGTKALDLTKGTGYLLLLQPSTRGKKEPYPVFDLTRGAGGAKPLPAEGSAATLDAASRLAEIQRRHNDEYVWTALPELLQDANPLLVDNALDLYLKFRRESPALAPSLESLLEHPRPDFRRRAAVLLGRVLARPAAAAIPERGELVGALTGRARRDDDAAVRRAATVALAVLDDGAVAEILRAIARDDPDQDVRFEAEKALSERPRDAAAKRSD